MSTTLRTQALFHLMAPLIVNYFRSMMAETNQWVGSYISDTLSSKITYHLGGKKSSKTEKCSSQFNFVVHL